MGLRGKLLVAAPGMSDPNFARTVVLIAEHSSEGALGVVLNRRSDLDLRTLWKSVTGKETALEALAIVGGPVQTSLVLILHGRAELAEEEPIVPGVFLGRELEVLKKLVARAEAGEAEREEFRLYLGYAGWGPGQLDREMKAGGWLTLNAEPAHAFNDAPERLWPQSMQALGGAFKLFASMPEKPGLN